MCPIVSVAFLQPACRARLSSQSLHSRSVRDLVMSSILQSTLHFFTGWRSLLAPSGASVLSPTAIADQSRGGFEMEGSSGKSLSYIVGGSSGMGLATARLLVADGRTVVLVAREQDKLAARKGELEAGGKGKVETITADFYDAGAVKSLIAKIDAETRHINHL